MKIQSEQTYQIFLRKKTAFDEEKYCLFPGQPSIITKVTVAKTFQSEQLVRKFCYNLFLSRA